MCKVIVDGELVMMRDKLPKLLPVMCCHGLIGCSWMINPNLGASFQIKTPRITLKVIHLDF
jgi:hypothetical protein